MHIRFALLRVRRRRAKRSRHAHVLLPLGAASVLIVTLFVFAPGTSRAQDACADVNGDGNISPTDALVILNAAVGVEVPLECSDGAALDGGNAVAPEDGCGDVNGDGQISPTDALMVLNRSVGVEIEFSCSGGAAVRNRVRYLNALVCNDKVFTSTLRLPAEDLQWQSRSGVHSAYKDYDKEQLGGGWEVTLGTCGSRDFSDLVNLPEGRLVRVELGLSDFGTLDLTFWNEGPIALTAGVPLGVVSVPAPAGLSRAK